MNKGYHYTECGLDNIWLVNGFDRVDSPYGPATTIQDVDGLHATIGMKITDQPGVMTSAEVRFLRHELDLSQKVLAGLLGVDQQTVARWEKNGKPDITGPAQRLLAAIYRESVTGDLALYEKLKKLSELDAEYHKLVHLALSDDQEWVVCAA